MYGRSTTNGYGIACIIGGDDVTLFSHIDNAGEHFAANKEVISALCRRT